MSCTATYTVRAGDVGPNGILVNTAVANAADRVRPAGRVQSVVGSDQRVHRRRGHQDGRQRHPARRSRTSRSPSRQPTTVRASPSRSSSPICCPADRLVFVVGHARRGRRPTTRRRGGGHPDLAVGADRDLADRRHGAHERRGHQLGDAHRHGARPTSTRATTVPDGDHHPDAHGRPRGHEVRRPSPTCRSAAQRQFTISVQNLGPSPASGVTLRRPPPGLTVRRGRVERRRHVRPGHRDLDGRRPRGRRNGDATPSSSPLRSSGRTPTSSPSTTSTPTDNNSANNSGNATLTCVPRDADLYVKKAVFPQQALVGDQVTYQVEIGNKGPDAVHGRVRHRHRAARPGLSATDPPNSSAPGTLTFGPDNDIRWDVGTMAFGATEQATIYAVVDTPGPRSTPTKIDAPEPRSTRRRTDNISTASLSPTSPGGHRRDQVGDGQLRGTDRRRPARAERHLHDHRDEPRRRRRRPTWCSRTCSTRSSRSCPPHRRRAPSTRPRATWTVGTLAPGQTVTLTIVATRLGGGAERQHDLPGKPRPARHQPVERPGERDDQRDRGGRPGDHEGQHADGRPARRHRRLHHHDHATTARTTRSTSSATTRS